MHAIPDRWLAELSVGDPVDIAAARTLRDRLRAVQHYLPLAAKKAEEDVEHIHQLRVCTRRATAALGLYRHVLPKRRYRRLKKQLRRIRRAANNARDTDVLIQRLNNKPPSHETRRWLKTALAERNKAQGAVVVVYERLQRNDRFARQIGKLLKRVATKSNARRRQAPRFGDWAEQRLRDAVREFLAAVPRDRNDTGALHRFRIVGKQLRYVIEMLAVAFPDRLRTELYPTIEEMQDRLGAINDLATARARLREKIKRAPTRAKANDWRRLLTAERAQLEQSRCQFWDWCTVGMLDNLRTEFAALTPMLAPGKTGAPWKTWRFSTIPTIAENRCRETPKRDDAGSDSGFRPDLE